MKQGDYLPEVEGCIYDIWAATLQNQQMSVRQAKIQISLGIHPVWSESSLSAWRKFGSLATHWQHSEDWSDWADAQADLSSLGAQSFCWFCHEVTHIYPFLFD